MHSGKCRHTHEHLHSCAQMCILLSPFLLHTQLHLICAHALTSLLTQFHILSCLSSSPSLLHTRTHLAVACRSCAFQSKWLKWSQAMDVKGQPAHLREKSFIDTGVISPEHGLSTNTHLVHLHWWTGRLSTNMASPWRHPISRICVHLFTSKNDPTWSEAAHKEAKMGFHLYVGITLVVDQK